uniref:SCP domain-containing protein n=1 Tax=Panagrolaimus sp. JU765 TaxID=591449 RepID=A0AC34R235_9BILA
MPRKKTVVTEKIQRRTPGGKIISETVTKTVYFDNLILDVATTPIRQPTPRCSPRCHHEPEDSDMATEIVEFRRIGDDARYFDNWQTAVVREAKLIRCDSETNVQASNDLSCLYSRINQLRIRNGVPNLKVDDDLAREARSWAFKIGPKGQIRSTPAFPNNIWVGTDISPKIVDDWNQEMKLWTRHYFECIGLKSVGIGKFKNGNKIIVVAFYA